MSPETTAIGWKTQSVTRRRRKKRKEKNENLSHNRLTREGQLSVQTNTWDAETGAKKW